MTAQNPMNPVAGTNPFIDKLIGNAYDVIKYVAYYVKEIQYVALNMADVNRVSQHMYENVLLEADVIEVDSTIEIDMPEGVTAAMVLNSSVIVVTELGDIHGPEVDKFSWVISDGTLTVTISANAPGTFVGATLRWLLNWQSPIQVG